MSILFWNFHFKIHGNYMWSSCLFKSGTFADDNSDNVLTEQVKKDICSGGVMGGWIGRRLAQKHSELIFNTPICLTVFSEAEGTVTPRNRSGRDIWVVGVQRNGGDIRWQPVRHCNIRLIRPIQTHFKGTVQIYRTNAEGRPDVSIMGVHLRGC